MTHIACDTIAASSGVIGRLVERSALEPCQRDAMFRLLVEHFEGVTSQQFERDLLEKNWVILLTRTDGELVGFSTLLLYESSPAGEVASIVYSGDTIVRRDASNSSALPRTWIESVTRLRQLYPRGRYYWLLITSGFRTYRFLPVFWRDFYPRFDQPTPPQVQKVIDQLAVERFGDAYDASTGIVRLEHPQILRGDGSVIPPQRLEDPHVAFFAQRNPGHRRGDELVCLCEPVMENLTPAGRRMAGV